MDVFSLNLPVNPYPQVVGFEFDPCALHCYNPAYSSMMWVHCQIHLLNVSI